MNIKGLIRTLVFLIIILSGCSTGFYDFGDSYSIGMSYVTNEDVFSDRKDMSFKVGDKYFLASLLPFTVEQFTDAYNTCYGYYSEEYAHKTGRVAISLDLGLSKEKIISQGTWLCLEAKGWEVYEIDEQAPIRVDSNEIPYTNMPEWQLLIARELIFNQREWFKIYKPRMFAIGNLLPL